MSDCVFCKIISWEIPSVKIWEDDDSLAILDISPNCKWMTLLMSKKHYWSDLFDLDNEFYSKFLLIVKKIVEILKRWLEVHRVTMVMEWMDVDHLHIKLYPLHGVEKQWQEYCAREKIYFDKYEWYVTTLLWPKANMEELKKVAEEIKSKI